MSVPIPVKILVAGGFGVGKSTLVEAISDIEPLQTEANMTVMAEEIDDIGSLTSKSSTTVAMDFGRVQLADDLVLYLFGTPGQDRFQFMWDELARGAIGSVIIVDTRRLADSFAAVDYVERTGLPFVIAINAFDGELQHHPEEVRKALAIDSTVPLLILDARSRDSAKQALIRLVAHVISTAVEPTSA